MTLKQLFDYYGKSYVVVAAAIGYSEPAVRKWAKSGVIPFKAQRLIESATNGKLIARRLKK